jgi:hypothetical protein
VTTQTSFPASATLKSLGLRPGDTLVVYQADDDVVTLALNRPAKQGRSGRTAREFAQRWTGQFPVPDAHGDSRLEHIIAKHVK